MLKTKPQPKPSYPISEGIFGYDENGGVKRATTELYLPSIFSELSCTVISIHFELLGMKNATLDFDFEITGDINAPKDMYKGEEWKTMATKHFIESLKGRHDYPAYPIPICAIILNKGLRVSFAEISINNKKDIVLFDQTIDTVFMPISYPPNPSIVDIEETYVFYEKKTTAFYANLELNSKYHLKIELDGLGPLFENAPLFPYGKTTFIKATCASSSDIYMDTSFMKVIPTTGKDLPAQLIKKLYSRGTDPFTNGLMPALPYRGLGIAFPPNGENGLPDIKGPEGNGELAKLAIPCESLVNLIMNEYETLRMIFGIVIPPHKTIDITVKTPKTPIPSRIYDQLQNLDRYDDVLVQYQILNLTNKQRRIILETEILGLTDMVREAFILPGLDDPSKKKPILLKSQTPLLKHGILTNLVSPIKATLSCKVIDEASEKILYNQTFQIDILPHDQMLFGISSLSSSTNYNLAPFLGAWISPTDRDGLLDTVRAGAARLHQEKSIYIENYQSLEEIDKIVGAVFNYLKDEGVVYVNQPFTSKVLADSQRILLPEAVLKNKSGNCADLTIAFASILEGFGINSLIFITPNHVFIGWGNKEKTKGMLFLETTMIGTDTYENAKIVGEEGFRKDFLFKDCEDPLPGMIKEEAGYQILDLEKMRHEGIARIC